MMADLRIMEGVHYPEALENRMRKEVRLRLNHRKSTWDALTVLHDIGAGVMAQEFQCSNCRAIRLTDGRKPTQCGCESRKIVEPADQAHCYGCSNETRELCDEVTRLRAENERLRDTVQVALLWAHSDRDANRLPTGVVCARIRILEGILNDKAVEK